jgi:hypothetical protein
MSNKVTSLIISACFSGERSMDTLKCALIGRYPENGGDAFFRNHLRPKSPYPPSRDPQASKSE